MKNSIKIFLLVAFVSCSDKKSDLVYDKENQVIEILTKDYYISAIGIYDAKNIEENAGIEFSEKRSRIALDSIDQYQTKYVSDTSLQEILNHKAMKMYVIAETDNRSKSVIYQLKTKKTDRDTVYGTNP